MSYLICEKHNKLEKIGSKIPNNGYICMNRYCPDSFKVFCATCKNDHRDHSIKVLTIEDVSFLVDRLLKAPFKEVARVVGETLDIMKKLKLIKEFRKKIDILEKQIQKESLKLIDQTEVLIQEYSRCKENVTNLSDLFSNIEEVDSYKQFLVNSTELLCNLDYNFKKDKFEFGSTLIKQKEDKRRKSVDQSKRKIEEVRDYSMKIIEVILHNDDSEQDEEDFIYQKKHYEVLKEELFIDKNEKQLEDEIREMKSSNTSTNKSRLKRESNDRETQTIMEMISLEESQQKFKTKVNELHHLHTKQQKDMKLKLGVLAKEKENMNRQLTKNRQKQDEKKRKMAQIEALLNQNKSKRRQKSIVRQDIMNKIIEYSQNKIAGNQERND